MTTLGVSTGLRRVLVAGLGNPDRGDDGVGVFVAKKLRGRLPCDIAKVVLIRDPLCLIDDLADYDALVCVDAAAPLGTPGRIVRMDLAEDDLPHDPTLVSSHAFGLAPAIELARVLLVAPRDMIVYAIEGSCFDAGAALTSRVAAAAAEAADCIVAEVDALRQSSCKSEVDREGSISQFPIHPIANNQGTVTSKNTKKKIKPNTAPSRQKSAEGR
jgi:hydrogenase maturation protease